MADYASALQAGIDAAKEAGRARREIREVFDDCAKQVAEATQGKIRVHIESLREPPRTLKEMYSLDDSERVTYQAIVASDPTSKDKSTHELAKWGPSAYGYPVRVEWGNQDHRCEDKKALSQCLADLLKAPSVGEVFLTLMAE